MIYKDAAFFKLNIYIWNLTHGGTPRSENEYRIQIKERTGLQRQSDSKNLLLGWHEGLQVFAGFNFSEHINARYSASVQIRLETLKEAIEGGIALQDCGNNEIAVAFRPDFLIEYVQNLEIFHDVRLEKDDIELLRQATLLKDQALEIDDRIPKERQRVLREINQSVRDGSFRRRVLSVYDHRCAFCGLQLNLVDAAHILPVSIQESTDHTHNGIALCVLHHRAYDTSLVSFDEGYRIIYNKTQIADLSAARRDGGLQKFLETLRPVIYVPSQDKPKPEIIAKANTVRGWENIEKSFVL